MGMATTDALSLEYAAILSQLGREGIRESWLEALRGHIERVQSILRDFNTRAAELRGNPDWTPIGREKRLTELALDAAGQLQQLESVVRGYEGHIQSLEAQIAPDPAPKDPLLSYFRASEIRSYYVDKNPLELAAEYLGWAGTGGHDEKMRAIEDAPIPMLDEKILEQGKSLRAQRMDPEQARAVRELRSLQSTLKRAIQSAINALPLPKDSALLAMARTGELPAAGR
jgi:hypothetical protein